METVLKLKELGMQDIGFAVVMQDRNVDDLLPLLAIAEDLDVEFAQAVPHNSFYFHKYDNVIEDRERLANQVGKLMEALLKSRRPKNWFRAYLNRGLVDYILGKPRLLPCTAGTEIFFLDPHGEIYPCNAMERSMAFWRILKFNGLKRALKTSVRRLLFDKRFYRLLEATAGKALWPDRSKIEFCVSKPESSNYPLPSAYYDLIVSNAVVEHVADLEQFAAEVYRMLKVGGYFYAIIHNFYSLSGGHNLAWAFPADNAPAGIQPWEHLRRNLYRSHVFLNHLKPEQYDEAFRRKLTVLLFEGRDINHDSGVMEGERFLTDELTIKLKSYPRDLLLTRSWCVICRKA